MSKRNRNKQKRNRGLETAQGVRNLDSLPAAPSKGIILELPPEENECAHLRTRIDDIFVICLSCQKVVSEC